MFVFFNRGERSGWASVGGVKVSLGPHKAGLVLFDARGRLTAFEGAGQCLRDGRLLADAPGHFIVMGVDGRDLGQARALLLMSTEKGRVRMPFVAGRRFAGQVGEVRDGKWAALESLGPVDDEVEVDEDRELEMIVLAEPGQLRRWGSKVADITWDRE